jgi:MYXO-CTERM domain-containing protein
MSFRRTSLRAAIALFVFGVATNEVVYAAPILTDSFTYPNGALVGQGGWAQTGAVNTTPVQVLNNAVPLTTGQDVNVDFTGSLTTGSGYYGLDINITAAAAAGDYFAHFTEQGSSTNFGGRFFAKSVTGGFQFGIAIGNAGTVYGTTTLAFGTYHATVRYDFVTGAGNDIATVYINPTSSTEGSNTVYATVTGGGTDLANAGNFGFRQGGGTTFPTVTVDNLVVSDDFASASGVSGGGAPVIAATGTGVFGNLLLGATATKNITLTNTGTADTTGLAASGTGTGITYAAPLSTTLTTSGAGATTTAAVTIDTSVAGPITGSATYTAQPGSVVSSPAIAISANVGSTTYGTAITGLTPLNYVTPAIGLTSTVTGVSADGTPKALNTTVKLLYYTNSTVGDTGAVSITMRTRTASEASNTETLQTTGALNVGGKNEGYLVSDVADVTGMIDVGTQTDKFVLQMSYNEALLLGHEEMGAAAGRVILVSRSGTEWVNAVLLNVGAGNTPTFVNRAYAPGDENTLGLYGVDTTNNVVWAVLNHNSEFAVIPEPSTMVLGGVAMLGFAGLGLRRRRQKSV